jgi:hypothetical protein
MIVAAGLVVAGVSPLALIIRELHKAAEGYEDEHDFYIAPQGSGELQCPRLMTRKPRRSPVLNFRKSSSIKVVWLLSGAKTWLAYLGVN